MVNDLAGLLYQGSTSRDEYAAAMAQLARLEGIETAAREVLALLEQRGDYSDLTHAVISRLRAALEA